jgi:hypothetical protein
MSESSDAPACGCKFVEDCDGFECFPTQRACDCACGVLDPESPECRCPDADDCKPPKVLDEECNCECPPCPLVTVPPNEGGCPEGAVPGDGGFFPTEELNDPGTCYTFGDDGVWAEVGPAEPGGCPEGFEEDDVTGDCVGPGPKVLDPETCECNCPEPCPPPRVEQEDCSCRCPPPKVFVEDTNECVCSNSCVELAAPEINCQNGEVGKPQLGGIWAGTSQFKCYTTDGFTVTEAGDAIYTCPEGFTLTPEGGCRKDGGVPNPDTCECCDPCPPNSGKVPDSSDNCRCKCPPDLPECPAGQFRALSNCQCYCPPGFYELDGECVECDETCDPPPPCYPIPLPPVGDPILCPDGSQRGVVFYTFNPSSCSWSPNELIFRVCPPDDSSDSDGSFPSSSSGDDCDCDGAIGEAGTFELDFVCGFPVVTRQGAGMNFGPGGCSASYTIYEWCDECGESGGPVLRSVQTFSFNTASCEFVAGPLLELPCPESSSSDSSAGESSSGPSGMASSGSSSSYNSSEGDNPLP